MTLQQQDRALSFGGVLRVREFRWLWLADIQSLLGDQLARVAVTVIVFQATHSGLVTSAVYGLTFLPAVVGTPLGVLADRLPRRALLVTGDLVRAALLAVMAVPGMPWPYLVPLLVVAVVVGAPWKAAESALVADILSGEGYALGSGLRLATSQAAQLVGFAAGGGVVAGLGSHVALAVDAATFAISAVLIRFGVAARAPHREADAGRSSGMWVGVAAVRRSPRLRYLLGLAWLAGAYVVPEGLAAPYAASLGYGAAEVGLLLACMPAGTLVSSLTFVRWIPAATRRTMMPVLAVAAGLPLAACAARPGLLVTLLLWMLSGAAMAYQLQAMTDFVQACPVPVRGQAIAFASSGLLAVEGVGLVLGGALAQAVGAPATVAWAGATGALLAVLLALLGRPYAGRRAS